MKRHRSNLLISDAWAAHVMIPQAAVQVAGKDAITGEVLQATEDVGEDGDNDQSRLRRAKNSVYRAANTVKNVTVRAVGKLF